MDAHVFRLLAAELAHFMSGGRVEKIQSPAADLTVFTVFNHGLKRKVVLRAHRQTPALYLSDLALPNPPAPKSSTMRLRKYIEGRRLGGALADWPARRINFNVPVAPGEPACRLVLDLAAGASLAAEASALPDPPLWPDPEVWPPAQGEEEALRRAYPVLSPLLRKSLSALDQLDARALLADLQDEAERGGGTLHLYAQAELPCLLTAWPLPEAAYPGFTELPLPEGSYPGLTAARSVYEPQILAYLGLQEVKAAARPQESAERRLRRLLKKLDQEEERLSGLLRLREEAKLLQGELWRFASDARLPELTVRPGEGPARSIKLDPLKNLRENMAAMFHQSGRGARGLQILAERRHAVQAELAAVQSGLMPPERATRKDGQGEKRRPPASGASLVQAFVSSDGFTLLRGRSAKGNQKLLKMALPHDLWLHAQGGPSAHLVIRRAHLGAEVPDRTLLEAGALVALKSWRKDDAKAEIICALVKDVRPVKGGAPGSVLVDKLWKSFTVKPEPDLESALASQVKSPEETGGNH